MFFEKSWYLHIFLVTHYSTIIYNTLLSLYPEKSLYRTFHRKLIRALQRFNKRDTRDTSRILISPRGNFLYVRIHKTSICSTTHVCSPIAVNRINYQNFYLLFVLRQKGIQSKVVWTGSMNYQWKDSKSQWPNRSHDINLMGPSYTLHKIFCTAAKLTLRRGPYRFYDHYMLPCP